MKKIFAFILATIMVVSLVPASVFAAITKGCPDTHTVNNCEYDFVDKQNATCQKVGYTVYECKACGEQFLADFVNKLEHNWKDNSNTSDRKNVAVNCNTQTDGKTYVKCSVCSTVPNKGTADEGFIRTEWETSHKLGAATGFGCEAKSKCSVCSNYFYGFDAETGYGKTEGAHTWEFTKVVTEPERVNGVITKGSALYTCKDCGTPKYVDIFAPDCRCNGFQDIYCTNIISHKDATCDAEGTLAVYECDDCNQLYSYNKSTKKYAAIEKVEDAVIPAKGHTAKDGTTSTKGCTTTYTCKTCSAKVTSYAHDKGDAYIEISAYSEVTCTTYGYSVWLCTYCGWNEAKFEEPTGHEIKSASVASTCATFGYTFTYCVNEHCDLAAVPVYTVNGYTYNVQIENEDGEMINTKVISVTRGTSINAAAHDYECIAANKVSCGVAGYEVYKCKNCGNIYTKTIPATQHQFDTTKEEYVAASCSTAGYIKQFCVKCNQYVTVATLPATPGVHNYEVVEIHSNCGIPTVDTYNKNGVWYHTWEIYKCTGCSATITVHSNPVTTTDVKTTFDSYEEAELYHVGAATLVNGEWVYASQYDGLKPVSSKPSTCYSNGYALYECNDCNQLVYVTLPKAEHPAGSIIATAAKAPTCSKAGNIAYNTCYICGLIFVYEDGAQKNISLAETVLNPHSATLKKVEVKDCAGKVVATYYKCIQTNNNKTCGKLFTDATASTTYTGVTKDASHTWSSIVDYVAATCNKNGTVGIEYCTTCEKFQITENYVTSDYTIKKATTEYDTVAEAEQHVLETSESVIDILVSANKVVTANTIAIPMFNHADGEAIVSTRFNGKDCSEPSYTHNDCVLCDFEYLDNYSPASSSKGHVNKYGVSLEGDCGYLESIKAADRVCFYCGKTVEPKHTNLDDAIEVEATCTIDGYKYNYCVDCGKRNVVEVIFADADAYHADAANRVKVGVAEDYANAGDYYWACKECGKALSKTQKVACPGAGLEFVLSSDAESYIAGSTVKVTIALDSYKGVNVWGLSFPVVYDAAAFEFLGYEFNSDVFPTFVVNEIKSYTIGADNKLSKEKESIGIISIAANADENVAVKGAMTLVTLEFKVITAYAGELAIYVDESAMAPIAFDTNPRNNQLVATDYATYELVVVDEKGKTLDNKYINYNKNDGNQILYVNLEAYLDVNKDDTVNMADALALYEYIVFDEYDVVADANCDGKVTMEDLTLLYNVITGVITVDDIINPVVVEEIQYDENGNAILPEDFVPGVDGARN